MGDTVNYSKDSGHPSLSNLEDGTKIRYKYTKGEYAGRVVEAEIQEGHIIYQEDKCSPTEAAHRALCEIRGEAYEQNGWKWWEFFHEEDEEWKKLDYIRDDS